MVLVVLLDTNCIMSVFVCDMCEWHIPMSITHVEKVWLHLESYVFIRQGFNNIFFNFNIINATYGIIVLENDFNPCGELRCPFCAWTTYHCKLSCGWCCCVAATFLWAKLEMFKNAQLYYLLHASSVNHKTIYSRFKLKTTL